MRYTNKKFTSKQVKAAGSTNLEEWLRSQGEQLTHSGCEWRWARHDSVTIRGNMWYQHSEETGGDAIDFVRRFYGHSFAEAVNKLSKSNKSLTSVFNKPKYTKPFALPPRNFSSAHVVCYLTEMRGIDAEVVQHFIDAGTLYEDSEYHNCVFVGLDENDVPRYAHKRSSYESSGFRCDVEGSDKEYYAFHHLGTSPELYVFEAPIDMLSYITLNKDDWQRHSYIALGGVGASPLFSLLERQPHIVAVAICLDNDRAGIKACERIEKQLLEKGYGVRKEIPREKDWNKRLTANEQVSLVNNAIVL